MIYEYKYEDTGEVVERHQSIHEDALTEIDGRKVTRLFGLGLGTNEGTVTNDRKYPYASSRLPRGLEGCKTDRNGKPIITSKKHEREIMARHGYARE
jgi:hypothetical protein